MPSRRFFLSGALALSAWRAKAEEPDPIASAIRAATKRADLLLRGQGLRQGRVVDRLDALFHDERWLYPDDDAGRERAVADMNGRLAALRPRLRVAFGDLPIGQFQVRRMPPADVVAGKAGYRTEAAYYVDLRAIRRRPIWTLPSVAFHEVIPGHLLQLGVEPKANKSPAFEGWACYAEQLAADLGAYATDPLAEIGFLHWRLFRLARAVADAGLSSRAWSRDRAISEMRAIQGPAIAFVTIEDDVQRLAARPGQAASEASVMLAFERNRPLRREAWPSWHAEVLRALVRCC
jgi:uncharacterized protein (DUF885 family)